MGEAPLERGEAGLVPQGEGWFVVNDVAYAGTPAPGWTTLGLRW